MSAALALVPGGPPSPQPGQFPILSATAHQASLWVLAPPGRGPGRTLRADIGDRVQRARDVARTALSTSLPLLWSSLEATKLEDWSLAQLATYTTGDQRVPTAFVDGDSCGLSLYLSMASLVFDHPLPGHWAASAAVDERGALHNVGYLGQKIELLANCAPRITHLLVSADQEEEAKRLAEGRLQIRGFDSAVKALTEVFGGPESLAEILAADSRPEAQAELANEFFRLTLTGRAALPYWTPVRRAAAIAMERFTLSALDRAKLQFAHAVAARHEGVHEEAEAIPDPSFISQLPASLRVDVVAHYVQHAGDVGHPSLETTVALLEEHRKNRGAAAQIPELRLQGAYGRYLSLHGEPAEALELQIEAAHAFFESFEYREATYPLSEWYRLAAVLGDAAQFDAAEAFRERLARTDGLAYGGNVFVEHERAKGAIRLGRGADPAARDRLLHLVAPAAQAPHHIVCSAYRWIAQLPPGAANAERATAQQRLRDLAAASDKPDLARQATLALALLDLDRGGAGGALDRVRTHAPTPTAHLEDAARRLGESDVGAYVARFFPY